MYKKIRTILLITIISTLVLVISLIMMINLRAWDKFSISYTESKHQIIEHFMDEHLNDLITILNSHAVWSDAGNALNLKDSDWLHINATGYIVEESSYNVDFIYISNENKDFDEYYGSDYLLDFDTLDSFKNGLLYNETSSEILWIDGKPTIITATPFYDNEYNNPTGCYLIGRIIDIEEIEDLKKILTFNEVEEIIFSETAIYPEVKSLNKGEISMSIPLMLDSISNYINMSFSIDYLDYIFNYQLLLIPGILITAAFVVIFIIDSNIKKLASKLVELIRFIKDISDGKYQTKIKLTKSKMLPEVETLIKSVNKMSGDIEFQIDEVESHAKLLDEKYFEMIKLLVDVVEMNDSYTYQHSFMVSEYALILGDTIGFKDLKNLKLASMLHDVGKISIATDILNKPGKLTHDEYEVIKTHPEEGYKLLSKIELFKEASIGVRYHHERFDGKGYPEGLSGYEIPLIAQIISVADIYEALTSDRSYRKAMSSERAMEILIEEKGRILNPDLVDAFCNEIKKKENTQDCIEIN